MTNRLTVLVVDDDEALLEGFAFLLQQRGVRVGVATSVDRAVGFLPIVKPDVILQDWDLGDGGENGLDAIKRYQYHLQNADISPRYIIWSGLEREVPPEVEFVLKDDLAAVVDLIAGPNAEPVPESVSETAELDLAEIRFQAERGSFCAKEHTINRLTKGQTYEWADYGGRISSVAYREDQPYFWMTCGDDHLDLLAVDTSVDSDQVRLWSTGVIRQHNVDKAKETVLALVDEVERSTEAAEALQGVLAWLVSLKDGPHDESYREAKDKAWQAARDALGIYGAKHGS